MKLTVWIEAFPWQVGNNGEFKEGSMPFVQNNPFSYEPLQDAQRFKVTIDVPMKMDAVEIIAEPKAEAIK